MAEIDKQHPAKREDQQALHLKSGRGSYAARAWADAYQALSAADRAGELAPEDLERLSNSAYLMGLRDEFLPLMERAHHAWLEAGAAARAARAAFWIGLHLMLRGEGAPASGCSNRPGRIRWRRAT